MKKLVICFLLFALGYTAHAQRFNSRYANDWKVSAGFNAVGNLGTRNPVERLDEYGIQFPIAIAVEYQFRENFALEQDISLNGFKAGRFLDNGIPSENLTYFSTNSNLKWYFSDYLFDIEWLELYAKGGVGIFYMGELNSSANLSGGTIFWIGDNIGISLQATAKFAINANNRQYANNHWQHMLQVIFRL
ncbi:MAG: hypothetical protein ABI263_08010 [Gelidibacter sp.]